MLSRQCFSVIIILLYTLLNAFNNGYGIDDTRMIVGVMTAHLFLHGITSLKEKRSIVKSLIGRLKSRFNISIAEVDHQDNKNGAVIGISIVSNDNRFIDQQFDSILDFMRNDGRFYLGQVERETF
jgi:uncharacterized protein YlxP (DUF503 family)